MAFRQSFTSLTMNGTLADGNEIFSAGFHIDSSVNRVPEDEWADAFGAVAGELAEACADYFGLGTTQVPAGAILTDVKLAHIGTDGKYIEAPIVTPITRSGAYNTAYAPQNAIVNTLVSGEYRDPGKYNRFYLPFCLRTETTTWALSTSAQEAYASGLSNFIGEINDILVEGLAPYYAAVAVVSSAGTGYSSPVQFVRIGKVIDTQRRRRNKLNEDYVTLEVPAI